MKIFLLIFIFMFYFKSFDKIEKDFLTDIKYLRYGGPKFKDDYESLKLSKII